MSQSNRSTVRSSLVVALGGFLLGFDSAVVSGVMDPVKETFSLNDWELGFTASCLIFGAMVGNAFAGPLSNRFGRRAVLVVTALLFTISAAWSGLASSFETLVVARVLGGLGVGGAILIAPIYIAEIAPPESRGRLVSFNQLNIVIGISAAFFSNYFINGSFEEGVAWRWMLGVEAVPAALYFILLFTVPRSPRWLLTQGRDQEAREAIAKLGGDPESADDFIAGFEDAPKGGKGQLGELFSSRMSRILTIALALAFFQQITGINAIFYYAATIFAKAGAATESALMQSILIGLTNLVFTLIAMRLIDRLGRRPLLLMGSAGMAVALLLTSFAFNSATYQVTDDMVTGMRDSGATVQADALGTLAGTTFEDFDSFKAAFADAVEASPLEGEEAEKFAGSASNVSKNALLINGILVLVAIMLFIASFAISLGPVMWAMLSEVFPMHLRGTGISVAGFFNSLVSFTVVQLFPWELENLGPATTFFIFGMLAAASFLFTLLYVPETKGRSLEELERELVRS